MQGKGHMSNRGQILIPTVILIIVVTIIISGVIMFLSEMTRLTLARGHLAKAVYAAQAGVYEAIVDYKNNGSITAETDIEIADNLYYSISGGSGTSLRIDASDANIHGGDRKLDDIDIYNIHSTNDAIMDAITISWVDDDGEFLSKINFTGTGGNEWTGSAASGVEIALSYTFDAGDDEEFKLVWASGADITDKTITAAFHFTDGTTKTATLLSDGLTSADSITVKATGKVVARDTWKRTIEVEYDATAEEIMAWKESVSHL